MTKKSDEPIKKTKNKETKDVSKKTATKKVSSKTEKISKITKKENAKKVAKIDTKSKTATSMKRATTTRRTPNKTTSSNSKRTSSKIVVTRSTMKPMLTEYYDLPYRYNQTVVKVLAQTPTTLFVYWDISDDDKNILLNKYGDNLFYETVPILIVHNITKNYSFEVEINDFANSWYIRTQEPDCSYIIELGRKSINHYNQNNNEDSNKEEYIHIYSSNNIISPNDHVLFEKSDLGHVVFKNVKTKNLSTKDFGSLRFINDMDKIYGNVYDVYSKLYKDETFTEITNPSSGEFMMKR